MALPPLPSLPVELFNMTAAIANTLNSLDPLGNGSLGSRALEDELSAVRSLATAIGTGLVANLPSLPGSGAALTADIPRVGKQQESRTKATQPPPKESTTKPPSQSEPEQISLPLFSFF